MDAYTKGRFRRKAPILGMTVLVLAVLLLLSLGGTPAQGTEDRTLPAAATQKAE